MAELSVLLKGKSLVNLINFHREKKDIPSDWQERLKKALQAKEREEIKNSFLIINLQQTKERLTKEIIRRTGVENKLTELEREKQDYFNELYWKRFGEGVLIECQMEQWVNEQMEDRKNQELLDSIDYKLWEEY